MTLQSMVRKLDAFSLAPQRSSRYGKRRFVRSFVRPSKQSTVPRAGPRLTSDYFPCFPITKSHLLISTTLASCPEEHTMRMLRKHRSTVSTIRNEEAQRRNVPMSWKGTLLTRLYGRSCKRSVGSEGPIVGVEEEKGSLGTFPSFVWQRGAARQITQLTRERAINESK